MADANSTIRFKRGDVEFELVGSASDVSRAWASLSGVIANAFAESTPPRERGSGEGDTQGEQTTRKQTARKKTTRKKTTARAAGGTRGQAKDRSKTLQKLLDAKRDTFPDLGSSPTALYAGYATLSWARKELDIDGLTASEIQKFCQQKLRIRNTAAAYRNAFNSVPKAVDASNDYPAVFRLMRPGEEALSTYLEQVAKGVSESDAATAADKVEQEAEQGS
jgi:hypothetical protein